MLSPFTSLPLQSARKAVRLHAHVFPLLSMCSVLHFFALVESPHGVRACSTVVNMCCKPGGDLARRTRSSAKARHESVWSPTENPMFDCMCWMHISITTLNRTGLSGSPCLNPHWTDEIFVQCGLRQRDPLNPPLTLSQVRVPA